MMEMKVKPMTAEERKYSYTQSRQLMMQTGCIGHLRADFGSGNEFYSTWDDHRPEMKTERFMGEFDEVINALREDKQYGGLLKCRSEMISFCHRHPASGFEGNYTQEYGFRVNTEYYSYLLRLNPNKGDYNLYCYCYQRQMLERHMKKARNGVRFVTTQYEKKFTVPDGEKIRVTTPDGEKLDRTVRFIDDYHLEIHEKWGENCYHICEFAELNDAAGNVVVPLRSSLPEKCYSVSETTGKWIMLVKGEPGYREAGPCPEGMTDREAADAANKELGVTKKQETAMLVGSLFGWEVPGADPKNLDENGIFIHQKECDRGTAR